MSCYYPSLAVDFGLKDDGKRLIKFLPMRADTNINRLRELHGESLLLLPCGKCLGCKCDKAKDWATRCYLESLEHNVSSFITLTYDDEHCPDKVQKSDLQEFVKSLRNDGYKFRYFGCGEYGSPENTHRPHYHIILFGFFPEDAERCSYYKGHSYFRSEYLAKKWGKGLVSVTTMSFDTASYVARYTMKKIGDDDSFLLMSLKPGIGFNWIMKKENIDYVLKYDKIPGNFGNMAFATLPRGFDKVIKDLYPDIYEILSKKRLERANLMNLNQMNLLRVGNLEEVLKCRGFILNEKLKRIERS